MSKFFKILLILAAVIIVGMLGLRTWTKSHSPEDTAELKKGDLDVKVTYCQPAVKGRKIFGELVPYNQVWRTGANEATVITFSRDVQVAGSELKAGKYSLWTIPTADEWTIIFNSETGQWGTEYGEESDVLSVKVPSEKIEPVTEMFQIGLQDANENGIIMTLEWENTRVEVPIK